jgi:hypothetical protein
LESSERSDLEFARRIVAAFAYDVSLPVQVRWCTPAPEAGGFRVGGRFETLDPAEHELLVEYCFVVQPARQLGADPAPVTQPSRSRRAS